MKKPVTAGLLRAFFVALIMLSLLAPRAHAASSSMETLVDGVEAFEDQKYPEAEALLQKALAADPENLEVRYYLALVHAKLHREAEAVAALSELVEKDPEGYRKAYFDIAAIYSAQSQHEKALAVLKTAIGKKPEDGRAHLEAAVVCKNMGDSESALVYAKKAGELDPALKGPAESLIASIYYEEENYEAAAALYSQVAAENAGNPLGAAAKASLAAVDQARKSKRPWFANVSFTAGYDDNVINKPLEPPAGLYPKDQSDWFESLSLVGGFTAINKKGRRAGFGLALNALGYQDMLANNVMAWNPFLFYEADQNKYHFRLRYDFTYYLTGGEDDSLNDYGWFLAFDSDNDRLATHRIMPALAIEEPHGLVSDVAIAWMSKDYFGSIADADAYQIMLTQTWKPKGAPRDLLLRGGYTYYTEDSEKRENSYVYHQFMLGATLNLGQGVTGDLSYFFVRTAYEDNPMIWAGSRRDDTHRVNVSVSRRFFDRLDLSLAYMYSHNASNVINLATGSDDYKYQKNMVTLSVTTAF